MVARVSSAVGSTAISWRSARRDPVQGTARRLGGSVLPGSPAAFGKPVADETEKWAEVVTFAGIKAE
jgi:hypothetical protein